MIPPEIVSASAILFRTTRAEIVGPRWARNVGQARAAAVFVLREHRQCAKLPFERIGAHVGRPGKSVWHWWKRALALRESCPGFRLASDALLAASICPPRPIEAAA